MARSAVYVIFSIVLFWVTDSAILYSAGPAAEQKASAQTTSEESAGKAKSTVPDTANIRLDNIEIQGRVEKPQTVFILPGKDPEVDTIQIDRSFFREIFRKLERDMLQRTSR
jgi:hypothetical protein